MNFCSVVESKIEKPGSKGKLRQVIDKEMGSGFTFCSPARSEQIERCFLFGEVRPQSRTLQDVFMRMSGTRG